MEILIGEDDFVSSKLLQRILETLGHKVLSAEDGLKALDLFQINDIKIVITDWMMPPTISSNPLTPKNYKTEYAAGQRII